MKISAVRISNFRSIKEANFATSDFNICVGQNNCGKTNFFEAIEFFYNGLAKGTTLPEITFKKNTELEVSVEIEFTGAIEGAKSMQNESNRTKIEKALAGSDTVCFRRIGSNPKKREMYINGTEVQPGTGFDAALNDFLPKFEYIITTRISEQLTGGKSTTMLGLRTTIYKVGDLPKATEWYSKAFETNPYFNEPYYVGFDIHGYELGLQPEEDSIADKAESVVSYWGVEDIQETFNRLIKLGAIGNEKPYHVGGEIMTATVKDPFGNLIGLIYNPHFKLKP